MRKIAELKGITPLGYVWGQHCIDARGKEKSSKRWKIAVGLKAPPPSQDNPVLQHPGIQSEG